MERQVILKAIAVMHFNKGSLKTTAPIPRRMPVNAKIGEIISIPIRRFPS